MQVTAYKAKDGTLHETEAAQKAHDQAIRIDGEIGVLADALEANAPYVDDWRTKAMANHEDYVSGIRHLLSNHLSALKVLIHHQENLDALKSAEANPKKANESTDDTGVKSPVVRSKSAKAKTSKTSNAVEKTAKKKKSSSKSKKV